MIKTIIIIAIVVGVGLGAWQMFEYWERVQDEKADAQKQAAASVVNPDALPGVPPGWETSLKAAEQHGSASLGSWLKTYGASIQDPRKAWIQLDYVVMITRDDPQEAKRIFADVKDRTPPSSPVWPRVHDLEKSYQ
ncbi:MAG TPA: hypothetical protein VH597_02125 [Verrucomicrobiae bacterium]|jgi:hypothetical protein|nr:hypothetical protein [Verrucomicrobiae bacterium]